MNYTQQMIVVSIAFFSITGSLHYYLWARIIRDFALPSPWRETAVAILVLLSISIPLTFFLSRAMPYSVFKIISLVPYTWIGVVMLLFFAFVSIDLVKAIVFAIRKIGSPDFLAVDASRRLALGRIVIGTTVAAVAGLSAAAVVRAARKPVVNRVEIYLSRFPKSLDGLKLVQISDLHIGATGDRERLAALVSQVNELNPDIIAVTGDLVDGETAFLAQEISPLQQLRAVHGTYFVTGNHEYYSGADRWIAEVKKLGIRVLRNESLPIGREDDAFYLAGVDDYSSAGMLPGHGQDLRKAMSSVPRDKAAVLLAHQPKAVEEASELGVDLVLSGHTHGGQIWPFTYFVALQQPYNKGLHAHSKTTQIYVNQGTFTWGPPMRLGTECEITEILLKSGPKV